MSVRRLLLVLGGLLAPGLTGGQVVRGTVVLRDSVTPLPGAIVTASDSRGATVARVLAGSRGEFDIRLPAPGRFTLAVLRIGYRPTPGPTLDLTAGAVDTVRIVFAEQPVSLAAVSVRERETCRVNADTGLVVARVWEEARKAMLTTQLATGAPLVAEWIEYDRTLDSTGHIVRQQRVRTERHPTTHAFRSVPAAVLASQGYVVADGGATTFYAPDAEVLLSDAFVSGHCFRLEAPAGNLIGVGFQPSRDRREMHEIQGTLWVDRRSAELRRLEFKYTNLSDVAQAADAGGRVEFLRLDDGNWLVSRWNVRMPQVAAVERWTNAGTRRVLMSATSTVVRAVQVTGGEVNRVLRRDSLIYQALGPHIALQVMARDSAVTAAGAGVTLEGTDYSATADSLGRVVLDPVLAGRYVAHVRTALMDSLALPSVTRELETREDARVDSLTLPGARDALTRSCPADSVRNGEAMLRGRVRDERGNAVKQVAVTVTWLSVVSLVSGARADYLNHTEQTVGSLTDDAGLWKVCGVPRETLLWVRVVSDSGSDLRQPRLASEQAIAAVDLVVHRPSASELDAALRGRRSPTALVEFAVVDLRGRTVEGATLEVAGDKGGPVRKLVTGASGRALLTGVTPGVLTIRARKVGLKEGRVAATIEPGRNTVPIMLSEIASPMLDTVRVVGDRSVLARHDEFETRRLNREATVSITREDIERRNPTSPWQMLMNNPSVRIVDMDTLVVATSTRMPVASLKNQTTCYYVIVIDGVIKTGPGRPYYDLRNLPAPDEIHGIEVFAGAASIPLKYGGTGTGNFCGMIAFWTR